MLGVHILKVQLAQLRGQILAEPRHQDSRCLLRYGFKLYSKSEEDGIIQEIFRRLGVEHHRCAEVGSELGLECNTAKLLVEGWECHWFEADPSKVARCRRHFQSFISEGKLSVTDCFVKTDNINSLVTGDLDFLSIDIDSNDYWIWEALEARPRVVAIEYNPAYAPPLSIVTPYVPHAKWDGTNYVGASLVALMRLGRRKAYSLVGCDLSGSNAFFVRDDIYDPHEWVSPATAEKHYEPARGYFSLGDYNPPSPRPFVKIS